MEFYLDEIIEDLEKDGADLVTDTPHIPVLVLHPDGVFVITDDEKACDGLQLPQRSFVFLMDPKEGAFFLNKKERIGVEDLYQSFFAVYNCVTSGQYQKYLMQGGDIHDLVSIKNGLEFPFREHGASLSKLTLDTVEARAREVQNTEQHKVSGAIFSNKRIYRTINGEKYVYLSDRTGKRVCVPVNTDADPDELVRKTALFGWIGFHKFYEGRILIGVLYAISAGGFGIGFVVDILQMILGTYRFRDGSALGPVRDKKQAWLFFLLSIGIAVLALLLWALVFGAFTSGAGKAGQTEAGQKLAKDIFNRLS